MFIRIHKSIVNLFSTRSTVTVSTVSLLILGFLGFLDFKTGDYSLIVFFLVPVSLAAWFVGRSGGLFFCFLTLVTRLIADAASGSYRFNSTPLHYWNLIVEFLFLLIMSMLFSALRNNLEKEKALASTDPLTGALNRRSFFDLAEHELNRSRRYSQPFTVAYIDLDDFKEINDRMGHHTGDKLLLTVVATIISHIRSTDILSRFGGDEFVLMLPETHTEAAQIFLDKLHANMQGAMRANNWPVSFSIGAISYSSAPETIDEIIQMADSLMYQVKRSGKNRLLLKDSSEVTHG